MEALNTNKLLLDALKRTTCEIEQFWVPRTYLHFSHIIRTLGGSAGMFDKSCQTSDSQSIKELVVLLISINVVTVNIFISSTACLLYAMLTLFSFWECVKFKAKERK